MFSKVKELKTVSSFQDLDVVGKKSKEIPFSLLGSETFFQGKVVLKEDARVAGQIEGSLIAEGLLIIEETSQIKGEIQAAAVEISGFFEGILKVSGTLRIMPTAVVKGEIVTAKLAVEEGAKIQGTINSFEALKEDFIKIQPDISGTSFL